MDLPSKDKYGNSYLSYSQINTFLKDKDQFIKTYILKEPFIGNEYTEFGSKVGKALELDDYSNFIESEINTLKKVTRLDLFEQRILINYDSFYLIGYLDTCSNDLTKIIDYKTGGYQKEFQYSDPDYVQLCYYAIGIKQETGIVVKDASVEFIRRSGNLKNGLLVSNEDPIKIPVDVSEKRLSNVYYTTIKIAKDIEAFYLDYVKNVKSLK
jgi:hypothetical protein